MSDLEETSRWLGEWWLPTLPDRRVPGILTFSPTTGAELELIGVLRSPFTDLVAGGSVSSLDFDGTAAYGRICGLANERCFTLEGCYRISTSNLLAVVHGRGSERVYVNRVIEGAHFDPDESVDATSVQVRLLHLPYWVATGGIEETHMFGDADKSVTLVARLTDDVSIELDEGITLTLSETVRTVGDQVTSRGLERDFIAVMSGGRRPLDEYLHAMGQIQDLVSIGLGRTATFEKFTFHHPDIVRQHRDDEESPDHLPLELRAQWVNWETRRPKPPHLHDRLLNLHDLGGEAAVRRWFTFAAAHRVVISRMMSTRYRVGGYPSERLMNRAAVLEALHRETRGGRYHFTRRITELVSTAGEPFTRRIPDVNSWVLALKNARNAVAHQLTRNPSEAGPLAYWLAETAYYLFVLCVLRAIDADAGAFERVANDEHFALAARRLAEL